MTGAGPYKCPITDPPSDLGHPEANIQEDFNPVRASLKTHDFYHEASQTKENNAYVRILVHNAHLAKVDPVLHTPQRLIEGICRRLEHLGVQPLAHLDAGRVNDDGTVVEDANPEIRRRWMRVDI